MTKKEFIFKECLLHQAFIIMSFIGKKLEKVRLVSLGTRGRQEGDTGFCYSLTLCCGWFSACSSPSAEATAYPQELVKMYLTFTDVAVPRRALATQPGLSYSFISH